MKHIGAVIFTISFFAVLSPQLQAQYQTDQQIGFAGLLAGSQAAPGLYVTLPLYWRMSDVSIYGAQNDQLLKSVRGAFNAFILPNVTIVTPYKILGATYGASFTEWLVNGVVSVSARLPNFTRQAAMAMAISGCNPPFWAGIRRTQTSRPLMHSGLLQAPASMDSICG